jgi:hypothetical protein
MFTYTRGLLMLVSLLATSLEPYMSRLVLDISMAQAKYFSALLPHQLNLSRIACLQR